MLGHTLASTLTTPAWSGRQFRGGSDMKVNGPMYQGGSLTEATRAAMARQNGKHTRRLREASLKKVASLTKKERRVRAAKGAGWDDYL